MIVDSMSRPDLRVPPAGSLWPALHAPAARRPSACFILLRQISPEFDASSFSAERWLPGDGTLLACAPRPGTWLPLLDERDRIRASAFRDPAARRDQANWAPGRRQAEGRSDRLILWPSSPSSTTPLASIDEAVRQIRTIVHNLRERDKAVGLVAASAASSTLAGFAASLLSC